MKTSKLTLLACALTFGFSAMASANCADNAVDSCNSKHPNPSKSDHAYELYELCIKAQLGQQCPNSAIKPTNLSKIINKSATNNRRTSERFQLNRISKVESTSERR